MLARAARNRPAVHATERPALLERVEVAADGLGRDVEARRPARRPTRARARRAVPAMRACRSVAYIGFLIVKVSLTVQQTHR